MQTHDLLVLTETIRAQISSCIRVNKQKICMTKQNFQGLNFHQRSVSFNCFISFKATLH